MEPCYYLFAFTDDGIIRSILTWDDFKSTKMDERIVRKVTNIEKSTSGNFEVAVVEATITERGVNKEKFSGYKYCTSLH